jgi:hypothetical protein
MKSSLDPSKIANDPRLAFQSDRMAWSGVVAVGGRVFASGPRRAGGDAPLPPRHRIGSKISIRAWRANGNSDRVARRPEGRPSQLPK